MTHVRERIARSAAIQDANSYAWFDPIFNCALVKSNGRPKAGNPPNFFFAQILYAVPRFQTPDEIKRGVQRFAYRRKLFRISGATPVESLFRSRKVETYYQQRYAQEFAAFMAEG